MPGPRLPVENYENLMKRYDQSQVVLVFVSHTSIE